MDNRYANYDKYVKDYYGRIINAGGYLHMSPIHYLKVGRPYISDITSTINNTIQSVYKTNGNDVGLNGLIRQQQAIEERKIQEFVKVYNKDNLNPITMGNLETTVNIINKKITESNFKTISQYGTENIRKYIKKVNTFVKELFDIASSNFSGLTIQHMDETEFNILYNLAEKALINVTEEYRNEPDEAYKTISAFQIRKIKGFIDANKDRYYKNLGKTTQEGYVSDPVLNEIISNIPGSKRWGNRNIIKTSLQVKKSFIGSMHGALSYLEGQTLEQTIAGYVNSTDFSGDIGNLIVGLAEGKVKGAVVGSKLDETTKKQQKVDIEWSFDVQENSEEIIRLSSKIHTGNGNIFIHGGGGLDSYVERFSNNYYTAPIAKLFQNPTFRYFFANEYYNVATGGNIDVGFRNNFYNALKVAVPSLIGMEIPKTIDGVLGNGVDFLNVNKFLIPVSSILTKIQENLNDKDYSKTTRGMSIRIDARNPSGNFISERLKLLSEIPDVSTENYYTDQNLLGQGIEHMNNYINHIKIGIQLTNSIISQVINEISNKRK